jgi:hypothetical protein
MHAFAPLPLGMPRRPALASSVWTQVVDDPGLSLANWNADFGTWAIGASGYIEQTNTAFQNGKLRYVPGLNYPGAVMFEAEFMLPTASQGTNADMKTGFVIYDGSSTSGCPAFRIHWNNKVADKVDVEFDNSSAVANRAVAWGGALDTWHKFRLVLMGLSATYLIDGVAVWMVSLSSTNGKAPNTFALLGGNCRIAIRNIKVWVGATPS